jgi:hypothetical protein
MAAKFSSSKTFDDAQKYSKAPRPDELVDVLPSNPKEWQTLRYVGPLAAVGGHWLNLEKPNPKKKTKAFYKPCRAFNPETEERDSTVYCPYCEDESGWIRNDLIYWQNAIVRSLEEDAPAKRGKLTEKEKETGFKEKGSKAWTPARASRLTPGTVRELKKLSKLNRQTDKKTGEKKSWPLTHKRYGMDVEMMYDPDEAPAKKYSVQKGEKTRLNEEQREYLLWDVEHMVTTETKKEAKAEYERWKKMAAKAGLGSEDGDDEEEDEDEDRMKKSKKSKSSKKSKKSKSRDEDDEDADEEDEDDEADEDEDNEFKSDKKSKKKKKKSKRREDDEDDDD